MARAKRGLARNHSGHLGSSNVFSLYLELKKKMRRLVRGDDDVSSLKMWGDLHSIVCRKLDWCQNYISDNKNSLKYVSHTNVHTITLVCHLIGWDGCVLSFSTFRHSVSLIEKYLVFVKCKTKKKTKQSWSWLELVSRRWTPVHTSEQHNGVNKHWVYIDLDIYSEGKPNYE